MTTNLLIREAQPEDAPGIARVHVDSWRATYAGLIAQEYLAALSYVEREAMWARILATPASPSRLHVAEAPDTGIVGFVCAGPERTGDAVYRGEMYALYLLPGHQRQGAGRRLFTAAAEGLRQRGLASLLVWVLADNHARRFYEALGGQFVREQDITIGGQRLREVAYGWNGAAPVKAAEALQ